MCPSVPACSASLTRASSLAAAAAGLAPLQAPRGQVPQAISQLQLYTANGISRAAPLHCGLDCGTSAAPLGHSVTCVWSQGPFVGVVPDAACLVLPSPGQGCIHSTSRAPGVLPEPSPRQQYTADPNTAPALQEPAARP